jgi:hypothetical protein
MVAFGKRIGGGRRSAARESAPLVAVFTTITRSHAASLVDVSATGARLHSEDLPAVGELVELSMGKVRAFALVRWVSGNECGLAFDGQLAAAEVKSLRKQVQQTAGLPPEIRAAYDDWVLGIAR